MDINKLITIKDASQYKVINGFQFVKWLYRFADKAFGRSVVFAGLIYKGVLHPVCTFRMPLLPPFLQQNNYI